MTVEQLANVVTKAEYLEGLGYFKTLQDTFNEGKFLQDSDIVLSKDTTAADDYAAVRSWRGTGYQNQHPQGFPGKGCYAGNRYHG